MIPEVQPVYERMKSRALEHFRANPDEARTGERDYVTVKGQKLSLVLYIKRTPGGGV